jgi:hypothetical protein
MNWKDVRKEVVTAAVDILSKHLLGGAAENPNNHHTEQTICG